MTDLARSLSEQEMVDILEDLARNSGSATARIQAIKTLRTLNAGDVPADEGFDQLDELAPRRSAKHGA